VLPKAMLLEQLRTARLTPRQTFCLAASHFDGLSERQIARDLSIAQQAVHMHIARARAKLAAAGLPLRDLTRHDEPVRHALDEDMAGQCVCRW